MNARLTILALVVAVISVTAAAIIVPRSSEGAAQAAQRKLVTGDALQIGRVNAIELERRGAEVLRFEREGETWAQVHPIAHPMDAFSIRQLIVQALEAQVLRELTLGGDETAVDAKTLGLDPPTGRVTYETDGEALTISLGRRGLGGRAYAQIEGDDAILVVDGELHDRAVAMDPKEWRQRRLFTNVSIEADRIAFAAGNTSLELRQVRGQWTMTQPTPTRADVLKIEDYVAGLAKAQVGGFILDAPDSLDQFGLNPGVGVLEIDPGDDAPTQRLRLGMQIGAATGDRFAYVEGRETVVRLNQATIQSLFPAPGTLVDPTGSGVQPADVKTVTISSDTGELVFERDLETWRAVSHDGVKVNASLVEELLNNLTELRASQVSIEPYPIDKQVATVTFSGFGDKPLDTVRIVKDEASDQWGLENGDNVLRVFPASLTLRLNAGDYGLSGFTP